MKTVLIFILLTLSLQAKVLISVDDALKTSFGKQITINKKSIMLKKHEAKKLMKMARSKIKSKIFKTYIVKDSTSIVIGYGVLLSQKIRSKNGVFLYSINKEGTLLNIEVIAFNEPLEYLPSTQWKKQFNNVTKDEEPVLKRNISTITGATLSAKAITDSSRIALGLYELRLKESK